MKNLILYPDPILRKKCKKINNITDDIKDWAKFMAHKMHQLNGAGISAPQVGWDRRFFVTNFSGNNIVFINPEITEVSEETTTIKEGCLSLPGVKVSVERPYSIKFKSLTIDGEEYEEDLEGDFARIFQHEYDHLEGKLIVDYMSRAEKFLNRSKIKRLKKRKKKIINKLKDSVRNVER